MENMSEYDVYDLCSAKVTNKVILADEVFCVTPSLSSIKRVVDWQLAKARSGTRKTKTLSEVSGTGKKPYAQKGSGRARFGTLRAPHMRGGCTVHGPVNRSHETDLPKKIRRLGLKSIISDKIKNRTLIFVDSILVDFISTKKCVQILEGFRFSSALFSCAESEHLDRNFALSSRNIPNCRLIPQMGLTVYDIIKHDNLVLSVHAAKALEKRLSS